MAGGGQAGAATGKRHRKKIHHSKKIQLAQLRNDINVTPLVDVCLVLLIIFMVVTPLMARGKELPLPKTEFHTTDKDRRQPVVGIDIDGNLWFEREKVENFDKLKEKVKTAWEKADKEESKGRVYLKADAKLPYKTVYPLIMAINEIGVTSIDLGTNERKKE